MNVRLIESSTVHLAKLFGLVKAISPVQVEGSRPCWGLQVEGRGFSRLLARDLPEEAPLVWRPLGWDRPRPELFRSRTQAVDYLQRVGL